MLGKVLNDLPCVFALSIGVHDDDATLPNQPFESRIDLFGGESGVRIAGFNIPEYQLQTESLNGLDGLVVEFAVGRSEQCRVMAILGLEQPDRSKNFLPLFIDRMHRQVSVDLSVSADFKKWNPEEPFNLVVVFSNPPAGQEEGGRDFVLDQIINECLIIPRSVQDRAEIESQCHAGAGRRARLDHLSLRRREGDQHKS